jgi:dTDP-4-dehydrorhamnose 3,5-epimerase
MKIYNMSIPGCYEIHPVIIKDDRGSFVKMFRKDVFADHGMEIMFAEEYYTYSEKGVLRGLHFQVPPHDHAKVVTCLAGRVLDAIVDLRVGSPTYGRHALFELNADNGKTIYLPSGIAHGFYVQSEGAMLLYKVTSLYSPSHDTGILWNSAGIHWPVEQPRMSHRDGMFPKLEKFTSPFTYSSKL